MIIGHNPEPVDQLIPIQAVFEIDIHRRKIKYVAPVQRTYPAIKRVIRSAFKAKVTAGLMIA